MTGGREPGHQGLGIQIGEGRVVVKHPVSHELSARWVPDQPPDTELGHHLGCLDHTLLLLWILDEINPNAELGGHRPRRPRGEQAAVGHGEGRSVTTVFGGLGAVLAGLRSAGDSGRDVQGRPVVGRPTVRVDCHQCAGLIRVEVPHGGADNTSVGLGKLRELMEDLDRPLDAKELLRVAAVRPTHHQREKIHFAVVLIAHPEQAAVVQDHRVIVTTEEERDLPHVRTVGIHHV